MLIEQYNASHCTDKDILTTIMMAVNSSLELCSKKELIATFLANMNNVDNVVEYWREFVSQQREKDIESIIASEYL